MERQSELDVWKLLERQWPEEAANLRPTLAALEKATCRLQRTRHWILISGMTTFALLAADGIAGAIPSFAWFRVPLSAVGIMVSILAMAFLFRWESRRRLGFILFEEISDEIEWRHRTFAAPPHGNGEQKPVDLNLRIFLRQFIDSTTLPFVSSRTGSLIYAALFLAAFSAFLALLYFASIPATRTLDWFV